MQYFDSKERARQKSNAFQRIWTAQTTYSGNRANGASQHHRILWQSAHASILRSA
jgi:hypothetical protein